MSHEVSLITTIATAFGLALRQANAGTVFMGEHELAKAMTRHVVEQMEATETSV